MKNYIFTIMLFNKLNLFHNKFEYQVFFSKKNINQKLIFDYLKNILFIFIFYLFYI